MVNLNACMSDLAKIYRILRMGLKMDSHFKMHSVNSNETLCLSINFDIFADSGMNKAEFLSHE